MIDLVQLRALNEKMINLAKDDNMKNTQLVIKKILSDDSCFFKIPMDVAYNILIDLGFKYEESQSIYLELINSKSYLQLVKSFKL